ncbi:MAG: penicillin-binding protein 2 [Alphaproteobacteria bacterium]|nr:penicillin-binding protein 2 [Alphaproteobacteria bacterium]MDP5012330.1 penicillin-binding protein 2 [Alphaproteobacteria bacterium]
MKKFIQKPLQALNRHLGLWKEAVHQASLLEMARQRVFAAGVVMAISYVTIAGRLIDVMTAQSHVHSYQQAQSEVNVYPRGEIFDRNGNILATHLVTASVYTNPKVVLNAKDAATKLAKLFPEVGYETLYKRLSSGKGFSWLIRHIPPRMQQAVNELGIPGIYLQNDYKRVYPYGHLTSHIVGYCGIDNAGLAGIEQYYNTKLLKENEPVHLSLDVRLQHIVHEVLTDAMAKYKAEGANAMIMDVKTGEMLAMISLPDFDPNRLNKVMGKNCGFNRNTLGAYEPGSTWKILNTAIALESGHATLKSIFDASAPVRLGRFKITDFKGKNRPLTLTEGLVYSSNIVAIKAAQKFGVQTQKEYFKKLGVTQSPSLEIPEMGRPIIPSLAAWKEATLMTASYGYGIAVTPLQMMTVIGTIINNGQSIKPTLIHLPNDQRPAVLQTKSEAEPIISLKTSHAIREMLRMVVKNAQVRKVDVKGYEVIGKTGTALQNKGRGYNGIDRNAYFVGAFPMSDPQIMVFVMLDNPKPIAETHNYATGGWNASPTAGHIIERIAPLLGFQPSEEESPMKYIQTETPASGLINTSLKTR